MPGFLFPGEDAGAAETARGADGDESSVSVAGRQLAQGLVDEPRAGRRERVPEAQRSPVRIQLPVGHFSYRLGAAEVLVGEFLRGEGLEVREHLRRERL